MTTRLTQALVNRAQDDHPAGTQLHDADVSGLRLVVGNGSCSCSCSWKLVTMLTTALRSHDARSMRWAMPSWRR